MGSGWSGFFVWCLPPVAAKAAVEELWKAWYKRQHKIIPVSLHRLSNVVACNNIRALEKISVSCNKVKSSRQSVDLITQILDTSADIPFLPRPTHV